MNMPCEKLDQMEKIGYNLHHYTTTTDKLPRLAINCSESPIFSHFFFPPFSHTLINLLPKLFGLLVKVWMAFRG